jgi:hypothetical protein
VACNCKKAVTLETIKEIAKKYSETMNVTTGIYYKYGRYKFDEISYITEEIIWRSDI